VDALEHHARLDRQLMVAVATWFEPQASDNPGIVIADLEASFVRRFSLMGVEIGPARR